MSTTHRKVPLGISVKAQTYVSSLDIRRLARELGLQGHSTQCCKANVFVLCCQLDAMCCKYGDFRAVFQKPRSLKGVGDNLRVRVRNFSDDGRC